MQPTRWRQLIPTYSKYWWFHCWMLHDFNTNGFASSQPVCLMGLNKILTNDSCFVWAKMSLPFWDSDAWPTYIFICNVPCPFLFLYYFICSLACSVKPLTYAAVTCCQKHSPFLPSLLRKPISIRYCCYIAVISALQQILSLQSVWRLQTPNNVLPCSVNWFQGCIPLSDWMHSARCREPARAEVF